MPTDTAHRTIEVHATPAEVMRTLRDVESQPTWIPAILEAEVLEVGEDGLPATARFKASATVGTDEYVLAYEHEAHRMQWTMLEGRLQTGQEGAYTVTRAGHGASSVTYDLTIHHNLPLPGFVRRRVIQGLVDDTLDGLKQHLERAERRAPRAH
jgi:hypothetical protein